MSIFNCVGGIIKRYGCNISVSNSQGVIKTKAFVEPLRYRNKIYIGGQYHHLGVNRVDKYLYIGPPELELKELSSVIETLSGKYIVKRCETYYVKDTAIYVWAILVSYGEELEDEYESD
jgi:hypothetical protein